MHLVTGGMIRWPLGLATGKQFMAGVEKQQQKCHAAAQTLLADIRAAITASNPQQLGQPVDPFAPGSSRLLMRSQVGSSKPAVQHLVTSGGSGPVLEPGVQSALKQLLKAERMVVDFRAVPLGSGKTTTEVCVMPQRLWAHGLG